MIFKYENNDHSQFKYKLRTLYGERSADNNRYYC